MFNTYQLDQNTFMEPNRFIFKLVAICLQYLLLIAIFFPLVFTTQLMKFNFSTAEIVFVKVLFLAIALALPFAIANAFSFAKFEKMELQYYLKSTQVHKVVVQKSVAQLLNNTLENLSEKPFWTLISQSENSLTYSVKNLILTDLVSLNLKEIAENKTELTLKSKPIQSIIFLDFGRNYRNILNVLMAANKD